MRSGKLNEPAETDELLAELMAGQPDSDTSSIEQRLARSNRFRTPFFWQNLAIKQIMANVVVLNETVEDVEVTRPEFGVTQPLRFHVYNFARCGVEDQPFGRG